MLNLNSLFYSTSEGTTLLSNITLSPTQLEFIDEAKEAVRKHLRTALPAALAQMGHPGALVQPRFFTQGSRAYGTLNSPAHPVQQSDIDDGVYLPLSFMKSSARPSIASKVFFEATEKALRPLVLVRGWNLIVGKPTCIRIEISQFAHIDTPLYAIPDAEFEQLKKAALATHRHMTFDEAIKRSERDAWTALPRDQVLLAHRDDDWVKSDPRPVKKWFLEEVDRHGEQFRRCVRYLKAFRDWRWESGGPSSMLLMAAAAPLFEQRTARDDLALLDLVARLPAVLRNGVNCPTDASESLTDRLGEKGVTDTIHKLDELERDLRGAVHASEPVQAIVWLQNQFGPRLPRLPQAVKSTSAMATVQAAPAAFVPTPIIGRTQAG